MISFGREVSLVSCGSICFSFEILLQGTAFGMLNIGSCMQQCFAIQAAVDIADVRSIVKVLDEEQQPIGVLGMLMAAILPSALIL